MTPETLIQWINQPDGMTVENMSELKRVLQYYPCFSAARVLYLKSLKQQEDLDYTAELFKTSLFVPDRKVLFYYMKGLPYSENVVSSTTGDIPSQNSFSLIDDFLGNSAEISDTDSAVLEVAYSAYSVEKEYGEGAEDTISEEVIRQFLEHPEEKIVESSEDKMPMADLSEEESVMPKLSFTETLAKIYLKQKKYAQALEIFKSLMMRNPEKSIYFADQIRFLEKLINHLNK